MTTSELVQSILQKPCAYKVPPFQYLGGHSFCPCVSEALRQSYIGGYRAGRANEEPEVGRNAVLHEPDNSLGEIK